MRAKNATEHSSLQVYLPELVPGSTTKITDKRCKTKLLMNNCLLAPPIPEYILYQRQTCRNSEGIFLISTAIVGTIPI